MNEDICENCIHKELCTYRKYIKQIETDNSGKTRGVLWHIVIGACEFYEEAKKNDMCR